MEIEHVHAVDSITEYVLDSFVAGSIKLDVVAYHEVAVVVDLLVIFLDFWYHFYLHMFRLDTFQILRRLERAQRTLLQIMFDHAVLACAINEFRYLDHLTL